MEALFYRQGAPDEVVGRARWDDGVTTEADDEAIREALARIFRPTSVAVDDPSLRTAGTSGPVVLHPGSLRWFAAAARTRSAPEGLGVRLVPRAGGRIGWDPAGAYRTFVAAVERRDGGGAAPVSRQRGEARPAGERGPSEPGTEAARPGPAGSAASPRPSGS